MKSFQREPSFLCAQTDVMKITVVFLNSAIAPKAPKFHCGILKGVK